MRSQLLPLLLKQHGQAGPSTNALCGAVTELQGTLRSLVATPSCRCLSAASGAADAVAEDAAAAAVAPAEADSSGTAAAAAQGQASSDASSSSSSSNSSQHSSSNAARATSSTTNGGRGKERSRSAKPNATDPAAAEMLQDMGLWLDTHSLKKMGHSSQHRLSALRKLVPLLREHPAAGMSAACINPLQLQTVVTPAVSREELHPLEYSRAQVQRTLQEQAKQKAQQEGAASSGSGSSSDDAGSVRAAAARGRARVSEYLASTKQAIAQLEAQRDSDVWRVRLAPSNLVRENSSDLMVNLNAQMGNALAANPQELVTAVNLFDQLLDQGIRAALEQQQQQPQQEGEGVVGEEAGGQGLQLPPQYRPDTHAFLTYCKAAARLAERHSARLRALRGGAQASSSRPSAAGRAPDGGEGNEAQTLMIRTRAKQLAQAVDRVSGLWDPAKDVQQPAARVGAHLHVAKMAAYRAAGQHTQVLEYWEDLRGRMRPNILQQYWRLPFYATASAMSYGNLEAADRYALVFSDKVNGVAFRKEDYQWSIGPMFVQLVHKMAAAQMWDQAVYWLQQLLNHDPLMQVEDASFLIVQQQAAKHGRMDLARVMMAAMDDTRKIQGYQPYVYSEFQCIDLMSSAARANDVPFIDTMWQRLSDDLQRDRSGNSKVAPGSRIDANSDIVRAISGDAAAPVDGLDAPMEPKPKPPSAHAHTEVIRAYVMCEAYGKAFELLHSLEQLYPGDAACSVYSGVRFFPESLNTEAKIGAAFEQLQQRQKANQPITTTMMNVLTRALARSSDTTTVGKVFNAYEPTYGLQPDVDTYNAVLESCESHAKVGAVNGMLALMSSRGVAPNTVSWNLLLSTSIRAGDGRHVVAALNRMREAGIHPSTQLLWEALDLAHDKADPGLKAVLRQLAPSVVGPNHPLIRRLSGGGQHGSSGSSASSSDRWSPRKGSKDSGSRASGSSVRPDSWRPTTAGGQESGEDEQVAQQARV